MTQHCRYCDTDAVHTPIRKKSPTSEQEWRCCACGKPERSGGNYNPKNLVWKTWDGRIMFGQREGR